MAGKAAYSTPSAPPRYPAQQPASPETGPAGLRSSPVASRLFRTPRCFAAIRQWEFEHFNNCIRISAAHSLIAIFQRAR